MFNMIVQPEKIVDFAIQQDGTTCYQVKWCDTWVSQTALTNAWQPFIDAFWKKRAESHQQQQQQQIQPTPPQQVPQALQQQNDQSLHLPQQVHNPDLRFLSTVQNNTKFLPNFSTLLVDTSTNHASLLSSLENTQISQSTNQLSSQTVMQPHVTVNTLVDTQSQHTLSATLGDGNVLVNDLTNVAPDFAIVSLLEQTQSDLQLDSNTTQKQVDLSTSVVGLEKNESAPKKSRAIARKSVRKLKTKANSGENEENTSNMKDQVTCSECSRDFSQTMNPRKRLREHFRRIHLKNGKFQCSQCPKSFVCRQGLRDHEPVHSKERKHACTYCGQTFLRSSHLYIHTRTHEEEKNFRCEACFATFSVQSELKDHCDSIHFNITIDIKCSVCQQNLFSSQSIYSHSLRHSGTRDWKCGDCGAAFKRKQILDQHKKRHEFDKSERKNFKCNICSKDFTTRSTLREHVFLVHNTSLDGAEHKCVVCGKCFKNWANYNRHINLHPNTNLLSLKEWSKLAKEQEAKINQDLQRTIEESGEKVNCDACNATYTSSKDLIKHLREHQTLLSKEDDQEEGEVKIDAATEGGASCDVCNKTFSSTSYLKKHVDMHSMLELKCDVCCMNFKRRDTLRIHKKRHAQRKETPENFKGIPGEVYNSRKELHAKIGEADADGKVTCPYCEKVFRKRKLLLSHIVLHGDFDYSCDTCGKSYKQRSCLNKHKRTHLSNSSTAKRGRPKGSVKIAETLTNKPEGETVKSKGKYRCLVCTEGFNSQKVLAEHRIIHTSLVINCQHCAMTFINKETFEMHLLRLHRDRSKQDLESKDEAIGSLELPPKIN